MKTSWKTSSASTSLNRKPRRVRHPPEPPQIHANWVVASMPYVVGGSLAAVEKTTLYLPSDLQLALREEAQRTGRAQAEIMRDALRERLARRGRLDSLDGFAGVVDVPRAAARDDEERLAADWGRR